jgi:hypothetical protein
MQSRGVGRGGGEELYTQGRRKKKIEKFSLRTQFKNGKPIIAIYGPMIYTAPYILLLMRVNPLRRQVGGGFSPGNQDFFGPREMAGDCHLVPKKVDIYREQTPYHLPK